MDELSRRRMAHNEELFRQVNEEIDRHRFTGGPTAYVCECADVNCTVELHLGSAEYAHVRESENCFIVAPGHVVPGLEHVVADVGNYEVVEKDV